MVAFFKRRGGDTGPQIFVVSHAKLDAVIRQAAKANL